ncbi:outer membrane beta-barrel protein [Hymenobacter sp. ISL-91]|nr:outer membrane beta-barrel protein [Hymenobacter sp. ISL-91]
MTTLSSWAQTDPPLNFPRWYAGLQYGRQDYQLAFSVASGSANLGPGRTNARRPQLTLGYQINPRLAVQAGIAPAKETFSYGGSGTNSAGNSLTEWGVSTNSSLALPILARYTLASKLWGNLQLDALGGTVLFWSQGKSDFTRTEDGVITLRSISTTKVRNAILAVGPSARYEFGRHLAGFADWMFYKNLQSSSLVYPGSNSTNKNGITNSVNLGIRYRFGYR